VLGRERIEGEDVLLGLVEQRGDFRQRALELRDGLAQPLARLLAGAGLEDRPDQRREQTVLVLARVPTTVPEKWTVQRCQAQPSTWASAAFRPG